MRPPRPAAPETEARPHRLRWLGGFTAAEARLVLGAGTAYAMRMLGIYMALPVLSPYAASLPGAARMWTGLSVGAYGLTQALFQVPMGLLGDRHGRGPSLAVGLVVFGIGSWVCAVAGSAPVLVLGRLVQGAGAMAGTVIALLGDRTAEEVRTRSMAAMGALIGGAFAIGLVAGPGLASRFGVPWLFGFGAVSSFAGLLLLPWALRARTSAASPADPRSYRAPSVAEALRTLSHPALLALDIGILVLHLTLTSLFVLLPLHLGRYVPQSGQWRIYAPVILVGFAAMAIGSRAAETRRGRIAVITLGSLCLAASCAALATANGLLTLTAALTLFVIGFACLEPSLAAQVTRHSDPALRGTAAGVFNTVQFVGVFLGGLAGGAALGRHESTLFAVLAATQVAWLVLAVRMLFARFETATPPPGAPPSPAPRRTARGPAG